jgi:hypothetical protein
MKRCSAISPMRAPRSLHGSAITIIAARIRRSAAKPRRRSTLHSARNGRPRLSYSTAQRARPLLQPPKWANSTRRFQITPDETRGSEQAGWHVTPKLKTPANITILPLPARAPELNPVENVWQFMRDNWLSNRVFKNYDDIVDHC